MKPLSAMWITYLMTILELRLDLCVVGQLRPETVRQWTKLSESDCDSEDDP